MRSRQRYSSLMLLSLAAASLGPTIAARSQNRWQAEQVLKKLVPEIPEIRLVPSEDLEPNPQGTYRRYAVIRGDFNSDGAEDVAICGTDMWIQQGASHSRNGYVLIASKSKNDSWKRVFFQKFPGLAHPFLIWNKQKMALVIGANKSDSDPGEIVWDRSKKTFKLVK